ncbi:MAG: PEP-CTERM sorting domain-containing protein [Bryobacteraceae bacterium]|nr:PEP-CTERM sorting domain-containing protein [Bryobacteraceae bacterium]
MSTNDTQLFVVGYASDGTPINPVIFLTLPFAYTINTIEIYGGDISNNSIPGMIESFDVEIFGPNGTFSDSFASLTKFGPGVNANGDLVNTRATLAGSKLDGVPAFTVVLSNFAPGTFNWVSITEIKLDGDLYTANPIPEPSTIGLAALALGAGIALRLRK